MEKKKSNEKPIMEPEFDANGDQTTVSMMYGRIDPAYLTRLLMEHKDNVAKFAVRDAKGRIIKGYPVGDKLARIIQIVIKKTAGDGRWRKYTEDWKEEMFARAELVCLKYIHNFDPSKLEQGKNNDPYYYVANCVTTAFQQAKGILDKKNKAIKFVPLNEGIYHGCVSMDQYAGVLKAEEEKKKKEKANDLIMGSSSIDETIDTLDALDREGIDQNEAVMDEEAKRIAAKIAAKQKRLAAKDK